VKHGLRVSVVNLYTEELGNPEVPEKFKKLMEQKQPIAGPATVTDTKPKQIRWGVIAAVLLLIAALLAGVLIFSHQSVPQQTSAPATSTSSTPATPAIPEKSIAVLPFENLSRDPDNAYFADGIQEEILTRLSKIRDLKVISRTSTQRYKSAPDNLLNIAKQLGVANILEGTVQKAADQVRVNVQLINAQTDSHLWADQFDRKLTDIFVVESEIATNIAVALQAKLTGSEQKAIEKRPTENSEAHQLYLKGRYYWNKFFAPGFEKSRGYYQQAIDLDPTYALAYAGLADYYGFAFANGFLPPEEKWAKAEEDAANKALTLEPPLAKLIIRWLLPNCITTVTGPPPNATSAAASS